MITNPTIRGVISLALIIFSTLGYAKKKEFYLDEPSKKDTETILRLQIFLDESNFGPGKIDGEMGQFTRKAVAHYNYSEGIDYNNYYKAINESENQIKDLYVTYSIKEQDLTFIGELSLEPEEQSKIEYMYYRSILEFVAERFHSDEKFIRKINPNIEWATITTGTEIKVPNITPFQIEDLGVDKSFRRDRKLSSRIVIIDTNQKLVAIWDKKKIMATFPITPGQEKFIHRGNWIIQNTVSYTHLTLPTNREV